MEDRFVNFVADEVVKKIKDKRRIDLGEDMKKFLLTENISKENKAQAIEQLYIFQVFSDAYLGPDPRAVSSIHVTSIFSVLGANNDEELLTALEKLKNLINRMQDLELNPYKQAKIRLGDSVKYADVRF